MLDLHIHSIYSDGQWTPIQLLEEAKRNGVRVLSITDHDQVEGYIRGKAHAKSLSITLLTGIELNTDGDDGELHILGYNFDVNHPKLINHIDWRKQDRLAWGEEIIRKLTQQGYEIELSACLARVGVGVLVRTHIADELVDRGYFSTQQQAYDTLLKKGAPCFGERSPFSAVDAIELIHEAGGKAFLAHPGIYKHPFDFTRLVDAGLDGIEVYHPKHSIETTELLKKTALDYKLYISGGSDFHGPTSRNPFPIGSVEINKKFICQWLEEERVK